MHQEKNKKTHTFNDENGTPALRVLLHHHLKVVAKSNPQISSILPIGSFCEIDLVTLP
jgi:hypothetical protein